MAQSLEKVKSLSSWRAWIEISDFVERPPPSAGRSPHGERGLKLTEELIALLKHDVALLMESVD